MSLVGKRFLQGHGLTFCRLIAAQYSTKPGTKEHIESLVKDRPVFVFMKGTPDQPRCGFSNAVVQILKFHGVEKFDSFNVLEDEHVRQVWGDVFKFPILRPELIQSAVNPDSCDDGIKDFTNWPTIPQVFICGEFVGGCDIMLEMHKNGELIEELKKAGIRSALVDEPQKQA